MLKQMSPEIPIILSVVAQFLAVLAALWLIWPLRVGPIYYSERSIVNVDGLGILPTLFAPSALILAGTFSLYVWATRRSMIAKWAAWIVSLLLLLALAVSMRVGPFFLPAVGTMTVAVFLQSRFYRNIHSNSS